MTDALQLWGGIECTINRVGEQYQDQLVRTGHDTRPGDLAALATLGISALRYPLHWERHMPASGMRETDIDWSASDRRVFELRRLGIEPIVGLLHHGSGPRHTDLMQDTFPERLAHYAGAVARRYPWVQSWTPVNEPLTTARFSGLYGLWYPHGLDGAQFIRMLLNECRGTALAMRAIRAVRRHARLVQTDDLGQIHSTRPLREQAAHENARRWLSWDLLTGRVTPRHSLWRYLLDNGATTRELRWFQHNACPPDLLGINHYVTSDRFLDHRVELYSPELAGGNGRMRYVDVEAVRMLARPPRTLRNAIDAAWERYRLPIVLSEIHLGCTREEQMRWLYEGWREARRARTRGVDLRAVTVWALLGSYDWNTLLTRFSDHYEPGALDVRGPAPRRTGIGRLMRALRGGEVMREFPWLASPGWWRRPERLLASAESRTSLHERDTRRECVSLQGGQYALSAARRAPRRAATRQPPLLITGGRGTLAQAFARCCEIRGLSYRLTDRADLDIADPAGVERVLGELRPWSVINAAGFVRVDEAEHEPAQCERDNSHGPQCLAQACARRETPMMSFSSDLVFDGTNDRPYVETDPTRPLSVYGRTKADAEASIAAAGGRTLVIRTSAFFGPWDDANFAIQTLRQLARGEVVRAADNVWISPTYVPDLVQTALDLLLDAERGTWHVSNPDCVTWFDFAAAVASCARVSRRRLRPCRADQMGWIAPRPRYSALGSARGVTLQPLSDALGRWHGAQARR